MVTSLPAEREQRNRCMNSGTAVAATWRIASRNSSCACSPTAPVVTRCATNQLRLWLSSAAYVLLVALRQYGLKGTSLQQARCDTIRLKLLKIGAVVRVTVRRVWFALAESYPYQSLFAQVFQNLRRWRVLPPQAARLDASSNARGESSTESFTLHSQRRLAQSRETDSLGSRPPKFRRRFFHLSDYCRTTAAIPSLVNPRRDQAQPTPTLKLQRCEKSRLVEYLRGRSLSTVHSIIQCDGSGYQDVAPHRVISAWEGLDRRSRCAIVRSLDSFQST